MLIMLKALSFKETAVFIHAGSCQAGPPAFFSFAGPAGPSDILLQNLVRGTNLSFSYLNTQTRKDYPNAFVIRTFP